MHVICYKQETSRERKSSSVIITVITRERASISLLTRVQSPKRLPMYLLCFCFLKIGVLFCSMNINVVEVGRQQDVLPNSRIPLLAFHSFSHSSTLPFFRRFSWLYVSCTCTLGFQFCRFSRQDIRMPTFLLLNLNREKNGDTGLLLLLLFQGAG